MWQRLFDIRFSDGQPVVQFILIAVVVIGCYFIGNINFARIIAKAKKIDITKSGSGNPGTMNMARTLGTKWGALTLILDAVKGAAGAILGWYILWFGRYPRDQHQLFYFGNDLIGMLIGGTAVVLGHIYPVLYNFKGGKGVASTMGVCFVLSYTMSWWVPLVSFVAAITILEFLKNGTVASFITITPPIAVFTYQIATRVDSYGYPLAPPMTRIIAPIVCVFLFLLVLWMHRTNIRRAFLGAENKTSAGFSKLIKKLKKKPSIE